MACKHEEGSDPCARNHHGECVIQRRRNNRRYYAKLRAAGMCPKHATQPALPGRTDCLRCAYVKHRANARDRGRTTELDATRFQWLVSQPCIYCGRPSAVGVDRVKNEYGYTVLNSVPCCQSCNGMKSTLSAPEYLENCARVIAHNSTYLAFKARWIETRTGGPSSQFSNISVTAALGQPSLSNSIH
jgi:hypothetical protein